MKRSMTIGLSTQAIGLLNELAKTGLYGDSPEDVGARFIDRALIKLVESRRGKLRLKLWPNGKTTQTKRGRTK